MRKSSYLIVSAAVATAFLGAAAFNIPAVKLGANVAHSAPAPAADEKRAADMDPAPFNPQMGALMNMIIQPRHTKLGLAGMSENWQLATYYFRELKLGFAVVSRAIPRWKGLPVPDLFEAAVEPTFAVLDFAIKAGEPRQFKESYEKLTQGCNNCHATTDHPFIAIKAPEASNYPNQEFKPGGR
jgi:hypothetical protein